MNSISLAQNLDFQIEELLNSTVNNPATTIRPIAVEKHITNDQGGSQTSDQSTYSRPLITACDPSKVCIYLQQQEHSSSSSDKAPNLAEPILPSNDNSENNQAINQAEQTFIDVYNQSQEVIILDDMQWLDTFEVGEGNMLGPDDPNDGFIAELLAKTENNDLNETLAIIENPDLLSTLIGTTGNNEPNLSTAVANEKSIRKREANRGKPLTDPINPLSTIRTRVAKARLTQLQKVQIRRIKEAEYIAAIKASLITLGVVRKKNDSVRQVLLDALNKIKTATGDEAVVLPKPKSEPGKWEETKKPNRGITKEESNKINKEYNVRAQSKFQKHLTFIYKHLKDYLKLDCKATKLAVLEKLNARLAELSKPVNMYVLAGDDQETVAEAGLFEPASLCPSPGSSKKRALNELHPPGYGSGAEAEGDESSQKMRKLGTNRDTPLTDPINPLSTIRTQSQSSKARCLQILRIKEAESIASIKASLITLGEVRKKKDTVTLVLLDALNKIKTAKGGEAVVLPKPKSKAGRLKGTKIPNGGRTKEESNKIKKEIKERAQKRFRENLTFIYTNLTEELKFDFKPTKLEILEEVNAALVELKPVNNSV